MGASKIGIAQKQSGFTLLELLVVIAVIGVLASLAVPRFQNQITKARFVEVINAAGPFKTAVEVCVQRTGTVSGCNSGTNGIPPAVGASSNGVVTSVNVSNGIVTVKGGAPVNANDYILTPLIPDSVNGTPSSTGLAWTVDAASTCLASSLCNPS